ncbi:hypothetical protein, partial [Acidithiobacillus sp.]|uniref:hypothetical protein n=1 Tax=Acidithiobacillus sp. TaxID=1872118 RepID=UPI003D055C4C
RPTGRHRGSEYAPPHQPISPGCHCMMNLSGKYSLPPGAALAGRFDQSPRACDYHPCPLAHLGLCRDFPATARRFP